MARPFGTKNIETPEKLLEHFEKYVVFTKQTPRVENVLHQKTGEIIQIPRETPISWIGFENYLFKNNIICSLSSYEQNENQSYTNYLPIISRIKAFIYQDKAEGATVGIFNSSIIARELGLAEKTEIKADIKQKKEIDLSNYTDDELKQLAELQRKGGISET